MEGLIHGGAYFQNFTVYSKVTEMRLKNDGNNNNYYYYYKHERVLRKFKTVMQTPEEFKGLQNF